MGKVGSSGIHLAGYPFDASRLGLAMAAPGSRPALSASPGAGREHRWFSGAPGARGVAPAGRRTWDAPGSHRRSGRGRRAEVLLARSGYPPSLIRPPKLLYGKKVVIFM